MSRRTKLGKWLREWEGATDRLIYHVRRITMPRKVPATGSDHARIMIVGEAPDEEEELHGELFYGAAGKQLKGQLREVGLRWDDCYVTNVCKYRPYANDISPWLYQKKKTSKLLDENWKIKDGFIYSPEVAEGLQELREDISRVRPEVIVTLGNTPTWALAGVTGVTNWRGSQLYYEGIPLVPMFHPAAINRQYSMRHYTIHDWRARVLTALNDEWKEPEWDFILYPTLEETLLYLESCNGHQLSIDLETANGQIVCVGLAAKEDAAICIPFITETGAYWSPTQRRAVEAALQAALTRCEVVGQNAVAYDAAYVEELLGFPLKVDFDCYVAQSVLWPGEPRDLGFLSSIYCKYHRFWKEDNKDEEGKRKLRTAEDYRAEFEYNCRDVCRPIEISRQQRKLLEARSLSRQYEERLRYATKNVYPMGRRGVQRSPDRTRELDTQVGETLHQQQLRINELAGGITNPLSHPQVNNWFYRVLGCKSIKVKRGKNKEATESGGKEALKKIIELYPEHEELAQLVLDYRSLSSLRSNFLRAKLDPDGRLRTGYGAVGTETFRLTSAKNPFWRGCNLLNITEGRKLPDGQVVIPNLRRAIVPDDGYTYFNCDLRSADLWPVVWEANDEDLKCKLREGVNMHIENAKDLFGHEPSKEEYKKAKIFVHLTNYGGKSRTAATQCGITVHEADQLQRRWFQAHPGIKRWHERTAAQLRGTRKVTNVFGYTKTYLGRPESELGEALAWLPQSTVAIVTSKIHMIFDRIGDVEVQMQGYDSIAGQYLTKEEAGIQRLMDAAWKLVMVPYPEPLVIPMTLETSLSSWGECEKREWPI